jgi:hypothetical protein
MVATHATRMPQKAHNCLTRAVRHAEGQDLVRQNVSALVGTPRGHASSRTTEVIYRRELRPVITTGTEVMDQKRRDMTNRYIAG